jgi:phage shock protein C
MAQLLLSNAYKICQWSDQMVAQENQVALPLRSHTILGVCEALGEDFGFNPVFLRIPFAASVIYSPMIAFGLYFALGAVVLASRLLFPRKSANADAAAAQPALANEQREYAKAA